MPMPILIAAALLSGTAPAQAPDPDAVCQSAMSASVALYRNGGAYQGDAKHRPDPTIDAARRSERITLFKEAFLFFGGIVAERYKDADYKPVFAAGNQAFSAMTAEQRAGTVGQCLGTFSARLLKVAIPEAGGN